MMREYFTNLSSRAWFLLVVPAVLVAYPVVRIVIPAVFHAIVPQVVQNVLSLI
jgi:hypothetical protein